MLPYVTCVSLLLLCVLGWSNAELASRPFINANFSPDSSSLPRNLSSLTPGSLSSKIAQAVNGSTIAPANVTYVPNASGGFGDISADVEVLIGPKGGTPHPLIIPATAVTSINNSVSEGDSTTPALDPDLTSRDKVRISGQLMHRLS